MIICVTILVISCSNRPSDGVIKSAITKNLENKFPIRWSNNWSGGRNAKVEEIEIKQIGKYNKQHQYWPVKVRVKGTYKGEADLSFRLITRSFNNVGDFNIFKDDYGNWKASISTMQ